MKLTGLCRLGREAELRYTQSGKAVASLRLAYNCGQKDESGNRPTQWVKASLWGEQAERLKPYLTKGTLLLVTLRDVHIETYEGQNGQGANLVGTVADIEFVPGRRSEENETKPRQAARQPQARQASESMEDDIPF